MMMRTLFVALLAASGCGLPPPGFEEVGLAATLVGKNSYCTDDTPHGTVVAEDVALSLRCQDGEPDSSFLSSGSLGPEVELVRGTCEADDSQTFTTYRFDVSGTHGRHWVFGDVGEYEQGFFSLWPSHGPGSAIWQWHRSTEVGCIWTLEIGSVPEASP